MQWSVWQYPKVTSQVKVRVHAGPPISTVTAAETQLAKGGSLSLSADGNLQEHLSQSYQVGHHIERMEYLQALESLRSVSKQRQRATEARRQVAN